MCAAVVHLLLDVDCWLLTGILRAGACAAVLLDVCDDAAWLGVGRLVLIWRLPDD